MIVLLIIFKLMQQVHPTAWPAAVRYHLLQCDTNYCNVIPLIAVRYHLLQCDTTYCNVIPPPSISVAAVNDCGRFIQVQSYLNQKSALSAEVKYLKKRLLSAVLSGCDYLSF